MILFSKKFLSLLVLMTLMIGGERHSVEGLAKCHECNGDTAAGYHSPQCGPDHAGGEVDCFDPRHACAMKKDGDKIIKTCELDASIWSDNGKQDGKPKCDKNKECYCNDADFCNKDKSFGLDGTGTGGSTDGTGGGGATTDSGSFGTKDMFPARSTFFWMMATVAAVLVSSICISTK